MLGAALLHAAWNTLIKSSRDVQLDTALVVFGAGLIVGPILPFVTLPEPRVWPYLVASSVIHIVYFSSLVAAFRGGDLSHSYPIMRGVAPPLVAVLGGLFLGEMPGLLEWVGIGLISSGVAGIAFTGGALPHHGRATLWALANAGVIAAYTLIDGAGVRIAGSAESYVLWKFFLDAFPFPLLILWTRPVEIISHVDRFWLRGLIGSACQISAYGIALWAMTLAPVAVIAALRETSMIFAVMLGTCVLREPFGGRRLTGVLVVLAGIIALKL